MGQEKAGPLGGDRWARPTVTLGTPKAPLETEGRGLAGALLLAELSGSFSMAHLLQGASLLFLVSRAPPADLTPRSPAFAASRRVRRHATTSLGPVFI